MKPIHVQRKVGMNPVAQAVFRVRFASWALTTKIKALMLGPGEACGELIQDGGYILATVGHAADLEALDTPAVRVMRGGLSALSQMSTTNTWDVLQAQAVVQALEHCEEIMKQLKPRSLSTAVRTIALIR